MFASVGPNTELLHCGCVAHVVSYEWWALRGATHVAHCMWRCVINALQAIWCELCGARSGRHPMLCTSWASKCVMRSVHGALWCNICVAACGASYWMQAMCCSPFRV
eukprot:5251322-Pyramimonas_sp.AAC.1